MFKIVRVPSIFNSFFGSLANEFHWNHFDYFRSLVFLMTMAWGRRNVSNLYRYIEAGTHRSRFNNFMLVGRWDCSACLRRKAEDMLAETGVRKGETIYLLLDDSKWLKRGKEMEAVGYLHDPSTGRKGRGHQCVTAVVKWQGLIIPLGLRLYVKKEDAKGVGVPFRKVTQLAAELIREFNPPAGVNVVVLFDTYYLCPTVVTACREKGFPYVSALKNNRNLFRNGRKLKTGRYAKNVHGGKKPKRRIKVGPNRTVYTFVDTGWMRVSGLGQCHVVFSRKGRDPHVLGIVTDDPRLSAEDIVRTYTERWSIEVFFKDAKQLLGLGQYQNGTYRAAVTHLHLVCFAYALLTHLRMAGEKGKRTRTRAAMTSTSEAQNQLRRIVWCDLVAYLEEQPSGTSFVKELERLLVG